MYRKKSDFDVLIDNAESMFDDLGNCFDTALNDKKTKMNVVGSIFGLTKSVAKLALNTTGCVIKNVPKAVVTVASVKREIVTAIEEEIYEQKKQAQKDALDEKIKHLRLKAEK
jgi:hypothetical protein